MASRQLLGWLLILLIASFALVGVALAADVDGDDVDVSEEADGQQQHHQQQQGDAPAAGSADEYDDDYYDEEEEEVLFLTPSPHITTSVVFPESTGAARQFPLASEVTTLVGVTNSGDAPFNITYVGAHLQSPYDLSYFVQNLTIRYVGITVEPGEQVALEYAFKPDKNLEPTQFWLSGWIVYNDTSDTMFRTFFHNSTIELVEKSSDVNTRRFFTYIFALAVAGLAAYLVWNATAGKSKARAAHRRGDVPTAVSDDWLPLAVKKRVSSKKQPTIPK